MFESQRGEMYQMWTIQEGLLQQYRAMAIMLLGLIAAGILVLLAHLSGDWIPISGILGDAVQNFELSWAKFPTKAAGTVLALSLYLVLLIMGAWGTRHFFAITRDRAKHVTFFQSILIAMETDKLPELARRHGIEEPFPTASLMRYGFGDTKKRPRPLGPEDVGNLKEFVQEVNDLYKPDRARRFLSRFIYAVFAAFFSIAAIYFVLIVYHVTFAAPPA